MHDRPQRRDDVTAQPLDDELVIADPLNGESFVLNQTGRLIWERCDGTHTIQDIAEELSSMHGISVEQAHADTTELVQSFSASNLLTTE